MEKLEVEMFEVEKLDKVERLDEVEKLDKVEKLEVEKLEVVKEFWLHNDL